MCTTLLFWFTEFKPYFIFTIYPIFVKNTFVNQLIISKLPNFTICKNYVFKNLSHLFQRKL